MIPGHSPLSRTFGPNDDVRVNYKGKYLNELIIHITNKCNLYCDYCIVDTHDHKDYVKEDMPLKFIVNNPDLISKAEFVGLTGGEPFMVRGLLFKILDAIFKIDPDKNIQINTSGCFLDMHDADVLNNYFPNIQLNIGIDGFLGKFKGLNTLLSKRFEHGYETLLAIREIKNKRVNVVFSKEDLDNDSLAAEVKSLSALLNCHVSSLINVKPDSLKGISIDDVIKIQKFIIRMKYLCSPDEMNIVSVYPFFEAPCHGPSNLSVHFDDKLISVNSCEHSSDLGCDDIRGKLGVSAYNIINRTVNASDNYTNYESKYKDTTGDKELNKILFECHVVGKDNSTLASKYKDSLIDIKEIF